MKMFYSDDERAALRSVIAAWKEEHNELEFGLAKAAVRVEVWRPVKNYEGLYEVSNWGRVKSLNYNHTGKEQILKPHKTKDGYLRIALCKDGKEKHWKVHRLVGMAFADMVDWTEKAKGKLFKQLQINHKDQNKQNNHISNLEWCDGPYNREYGDARERAAKTKTGVYNTKLSKPVTQKTKDGEFVREWPSVREVERQTGWNQSAISACCRGIRKSAYGFQWSYINV